MSTPDMPGAEGVKPDPFASACCPFCGEDGFDLYGLKTHINMGWCEPFEAISDADRLPHRPTDRLPSETGGGR
ncbi:hypothetical protein [Methylorubrum extorquens]|uniref:hypothetical protein n=1 Tax=Methylorubrum extorquens TaxID=408 RepID=UPI0011BE34EC|nr:hypothetical protein [Methylorubrum extorquens]